MSQDEFAERVSVDEVVGYIDRLKAKCTELYAGEEIARQFHAVVVVHSGHSHVWIVDASGSEKEGERNREKALQEITIPALRKAPIVLALDVRIAGGKPEEESGAPPIPAEWQKAISKSESSEPLHIDDVIRLVCRRVVNQSSEHNASATGNFEIPDGFVLQRLDLAQGRIARPKDWYYLEKEGGSSVRWIIAKEDPSKGPYETGMSIQLFVKVREGTGKTPRQFVEHLISQRKSAGALVSECPESDQASFRRRCLEIIEHQQRGSEAVEYRILYSFLWWDTGDIMILSVFGAPSEKWEATEEIRRVMSRFELLSEKEAEPDGDA